MRRGQHFAADRPGDQHVARHRASQGDRDFIGVRLALDFVDVGGGALPQWVIARALGGSQALLPHEEMLGTRGAAQVASSTAPTLLLENLDGDDPLACLGQLEAAALTDPQRFARALSDLGDPGLETRLGAVIVWLGTVAETFKAAQAQAVPACYEETACAE